MPGHINNPGSVVSYKEPAVHHTPTTSHRFLQHRVTPNRSLLLGVLAAAVVAWAALAFAAAPAHAAADACPNAELRALNNSTGLPDCRAYEMVTSPYKEGFVAQQQTYGDDGAYGYFSIGNFAGNPFGSAIGNQYVARRSDAGWTSISMNPPGEQWIHRVAEGAQNGLSKDLRSSLWAMRPVSRPNDPDDIYVRKPDGEFSLVAPNPGSPLPFVFARSADLSHVVVGGELVPAPNLYEVVGGDGVLRPIGVDNSGVPFPDASALCSQGISEDGRVISFMSVGYPSCNRRLWARVGGAVTIEMSASQCTRDAGDPGGLCNPSAPVSFEGWALDGSRAFFTTTQQLVNGDTDATNDLYACDILPGIPAAVNPVNPCPNLRLVSGTASGADVEDVVRVADDGSRAYFVAHGVLAGNRGANDEAAVEGGHNLYVWQQDAGHPAGETTFVTRLQANDNEIGANGNVETTPDGRYLLVNTPTPLVTSGPGADTDSATDVYRYDVQTGVWVRISIATTGDGGNAELEATSRGSTKGTIRRRVSITADGQTVVFQSAEALAPADHNSFTDVYAWHEGQVSMISADGGGEPRITESGTDIFFTTGDRLTAADGDTNPDVYDARVDGGFDLRVPAPCEGERCLGGRSGAPGLGVGVAGSGPGDVQQPASAFTLRRVSLAQRRALAQTGRVTLTVSANSPGTVAAKATATIAGKLTSVASARDVLESAGTVQLTLKLSEKARAQLAAKRRLAVKVVVSHSKVALARSVTLTLTLKPKARAKKPVKRSLAVRASRVEGGRS